MTRRVHNGGFTLLEVLVAVTILTAITGITLLAFQVVSAAWRKGMLLSDSLHHGDFVMDQLVLGLRSAYMPDSAIGQDKYGFSIEDNGDSPRSSDMVTWVKLGSALVGRDSRDLENPEAPHRVEFFVAEDERGESAAAVRAWSLLGQPEDFEPEDVEPRFIARRIVGFNCRMQDPESEAEDELEWIDDWEDTNRLPYSVEVTLWMDPAEEGADPIELKRVVQIPLGPLSWGRGRSAQPSQSSGDRRPRNTTGDSSGRGGSGTPPVADVSP